MRFLLLFLPIFFFSCKPNAELLHKKKIQTTTEKEDCVVILKSLNPSLNSTYYWYKSNEIHQSKGGYSGNLLHGDYTRYYITNQLSEKGVFSFGLKVKEWKSWFKNGQLKSVCNWKNGRLSGNYTLYDDFGKILLSGKYSKGNKVGKWIDYVKKDTICYKKGNVFLKKSKDSSIVKKELFYKRIFKKRKGAKDVKS